jgi:hypothetical protein
MPLLDSPLLALHHEAWTSPLFALAACWPLVWDAAMHASVLVSVMETASTTAPPSVLQTSHTRYHNPQVTMLNTGIVQPLGCAACCVRYRVSFLGCSME